MVNEPYKGLDIYVEEDQDIFCGRETETELITDYLGLFPVTILHGANGVGKSSILRAGVSARLRQEAQKNIQDFEKPLIAVVIFPGLQESWSGKLGARLKQKIKADIQAIAPNIQAPDINLPFIETLKYWTEQIGKKKEDGKLFIIFDHFEDFFLADFSKEEEKTYVKELARAINYFDLRVNFLISIRSSAFTKLERFKSHIPNLMEKSIELKRLDEKSAKAAIKEPIEVYNKQHPEKNIEIEDDLVEQILDIVKAGEENRIEAPYLQLIMKSLWNEEKKANSSKLHKQTLTNLNGEKGEGIVKGHFQENIEKLNDKEWKIAIYSFNYLVTPSGQPILKKRKDLIDYYIKDKGDSEPNLVTETLEKLSSGEFRILRTGQGDRYEIYFNQLANVIAQWLKTRSHIKNLVRVTEKALQDFDFSQIEALKKAIEVGEDLQEIFNIDKNWEKSPQTIPIIRTLRFILENIREKREFKHPNSPIYGASISPDGERLATASFDGIVCLWDLENFQKEPIKFQDPSDSVFNLVFSPDGQKLATASWDGTVRLWNLEGKELHSLGKSGDEEISLVTFSPDGQQLATSSLQGIINLWNLQQSSTELTYKNTLPSSALSPFVHSLNFLNQGEHLVVSFWDGNLVLLDRQGNRVNQLEKSQLLGTATQDGMVKLWDLANLSEAKEQWKAHNAPISYVNYDVTNNKLYTVCWNGKVRLLDLKEKTWKEFSCNRSPISRASFSPDKQKLVTVASDGAAHLWDLSKDYSSKSGKDQRVVCEGHKNMVFCVDFSSNGQQLATASADQTVRLWDCQGHEIKRFDFKHQVFRVSFSPNGQYLSVATSDKEGTAYLIDLKNKKRIELKNHKKTVYCLNFNTEGNQVASASEDGTVYLWDLEGNKIGEPLSQKSGTIYYVSFSPDGQTLAMACLNSKVILWDLKSQKEVVCIGHTSAVYSLNFSPDGKLLASASQDGTARLWDLEGNQKAQFKHESAVFWVSFQPGEKPLVNGELLATAGGDGKVCLWNLKNKQKIAEVKHHDSLVFSVCFSPINREEIATASADNTVKIARLEALAQLIERGRNWAGVGTQKAKS